MRKRLRALRRRVRIPMAIPALLLGLLALALVGRSGIGVASSGAGTLAPKPATTSVVPLGEATTLPQPPQVRVPDVEGRPLAEARQLFAEVGLPASAHDPDPAVPGSVVVSQEPPGGRWCLAAVRSACEPRW